MKNIHMNRAVWAERSSTWLRDNSAGAPSARRNSTTTNVLELVCASISSSCSSSDPHDQQSGGVSPHRTARVLPFPAVRAPDRDASEGAGGHGTASGVFNGVIVLLVEDDFIVAFDMQTALEEQGARVLGASSLDEARELLAPRADVWAFLSEPYNLPDWWPGIGGLQPDRRGFGFDHAPHFQ